MYTITADTFCVRHYSDNGYNFTEITIRRQYKNSVVDLIQGCVGNRAGYGSIEIAARKEQEYRAILDANHEHVYESTFNGLEVSIVWQHYDNGSGELDYCDPRYDSLGRHLSDIEKGLKFLRRVGGVVEAQRAKQTGGDLRKSSDHSFMRPERVLAALRSMRGLVEVQYDRSLGATLRVKGPKPAISEAA